jgi:MATE family multidrug resistance protein
MNSRPDQEGLTAMLRLAAPVIVINLSLTLMQFVDVLMVAELGEKALAASLPAGLLFFVPTVFFMGLLLAVNTFVSQSLGRKEAARCGFFAWQGVYLAVVSGILLLGLWWVAPGLFALLGHEPEVQALEVTYFRISLFGGLPVLIGVALSNFFIGIHRTPILAWIALATTLLNIFFNWVFIFGNLGMPQLGLAGAALGTVLATVCQTFALFVAFMRPGVRKEFGTHPAPPQWQSLKNVLRIGLPSGFQMGFDILSWGVGLIWMVGLFGTASLAATTIIVRCMHLGFMPTVALATVLTAMVGKAIGSGDFELANRHTRTAIRATLIYASAIALFFFFFRYNILGVFTSSEEIMNIGAGIMILVALFQLFDALFIIYSHALRGAGDTFWQASVTAISCLTIFVVGGLAVVHWFPRLGASGPWLMGTIYIGVIGLAMAWRWMRGPWRQIRIGH